MDNEKKEPRGFASTTANHSKKNNIVNNTSTLHMSEYKSTDAGSFMNTERVRFVPAAMKKRRNSIPTINHNNIHRSTEKRRCSSFLTILHYFDIVDDY